MKLCPAISSVPDATTAMEPSSFWVIVAVPVNCPEPSGTSTVAVTAPVMTPSTLVTVPPVIVAVTPITEITPDTVAVQFSASV